MDLAVHEVKPPIGTRGERRIVGDDDNGSPAISDLPRNSEHLLRGRRIKRAVGLSATIISGRLDSARAIATRWHCPPESWLGRLSAWSFRPSDVRSSRARSRISFSLILPAARIGNITFCSEVNSGNKMKLERKAAFGQADIRAFGFRQFRGRLTANDHLTLRPCIEQSESSDDLPDPEGPVIARNSPFATLRSMPLTGVCEIAPSTCRTKPAVSSAMSLMRRPG
jgi:hypothetical protein